MRYATDEQLLDQSMQLMALEPTHDNPEGLRAVYDSIRDNMGRTAVRYGSNITVEEFESNGYRSLFAYPGTERPENAIILLGHADVVPGKPELFKPRLADGKLYGRGANDMIPADIVMADIFAEYAGRLPIAYLLSTEEELAGKNGTGFQVKQGVRGSFVIAGECGRSIGTNEIAHAAKGIAHARIRFNGHNAHASRPWLGENAANRMARFGNALLQRYPVPEFATDESTVTNTGMITNGTAHNQVPDGGIMTIDARFAPGDPDFASPERIASILKDLDAEVNGTPLEENPELAVDVSFDEFFGPMYTDPNTPLYKLLKASAEHVEGAPFTDVQRHGTGDARFFTAVGVPACEFGIAGEHPHGDDEHITIDAFKNFRATLRHFLDTVIRLEQVY